MVLQQVEVGATPIGPLQFELPATRAISVVVRGATRDDFRAASNLGVPVAFVYIGSGSFDAAGRGISALEQRPQLAAEATGALPEVLGIELLPGDQVARFRRAPIGDATVCVQVSGRNVEANLITRCQPVPPNAEVVVVKL